MSGDDGESPDADGTDAASNANVDADSNADSDTDPDANVGSDSGADGDSNGDDTNAEPSSEGEPTAYTGTDGTESPDADEATGSTVPDAPAKPTPTAGTAADAAGRDGEPTDRIQGAAEGAWMVVREMLISVAAVAAIGLLLFAVSGVWPPMVAVESGSMEPNMHRGDLIVISEPGRYVPDATHGETGVVTLERAEEVGYRTFGDYGSVVVYRPDNATVGSPVIHRAHLYVEEGENWYDEANPKYHDADSCSDLVNCPAPNAGFITKGDNNPRYDQAIGISDPVASDWIVGVAHVRVPYLGHVRLWLSGTMSPGTSAVGAEGGANAFVVGTRSADTSTNTTVAT